MPTTTWSPALQNFRSVRSVGKGAGTRADISASGRAESPLAKKAHRHTMHSVRPGTRVEVRSRFEAAWSRGFEVAEQVDAARPRYKVRRRSDGSILPVI